MSAAAAAARNMPAMLSTIRRICFLALIAIAVAEYAPAEGRTEKFPLSSFDNSGCQFVGRSQDCSGKVMTDILAAGKQAIPVLISQLTDTDRTKRPIQEGWSYTNSGDVAYIVLVSLFTSPEGTFNLPEVPTWKSVMRGCNTGVEGCWREYVRKTGRESVQEAWLKAWNEHKDQIFWDSKSRCFRLAKSEPKK
jgi:hypothetical protein